MILKLSTFKRAKHQIECQGCRQDTVRWTFPGFCNNCNLNSPFDNEGNEKRLFTLWKSLAVNGEVKV